MTVDELEKVTDGLAWVSGQLLELDLPEHKAEAAAASMQISMVNMMVSQLALHLVHGVESREAFRRMATGETLLTESQVSIRTPLAP